MANKTRTIRRPKIKKIVKYHLSYKESLDDNKFKITNKDYNESNNTKDSKFMDKCVPKINYDLIIWLLC
jgi:hypothetical protein